MAEQQKTRGDVPKYRVRERCYLNDRLYDPEEMPLDHNAEPDDSGAYPRRPLIIPFAGIPAYYMEPVNQAAKEMVAKHQNRMQFSNPIDELSLIGDQLPAQA